MSSPLATAVALVAFVVAFVGDERRAKADSLPGVVAGYDSERGTFIHTRDGRWELNPYAMVQITHVTTGQGSRVDTTGANLHAAKFILHGHIYDPALTYHFQINAGEGKVVAEDVYLHLRATPWFGVLVGQNEVTFNRQHITLEAYQELVERSSVDARFNLQRDIGAALYFSDPGSHYQATVGLWNGARQNAPNDDTGYMGTLRLAYNPLGPIAFREADLADSRTPKISFAVAGACNPERLVAPTAPTAPLASATTLHHVAQGVAEATLRYRGVSLSNELHMRRQAIDAGPHAVDTGGFVQLGWFVVPTHLQLAGRVARVAGAVNRTDTVGEQTGGVSYYFLGHRLKVQADASRLQTRAIHDGWRARAQLEFFL
jgi:phosphate-selective porin OprO and OprP